METEDSVKKVMAFVRSSVRHQYDSKADEYGQRNGETNFNNKYEHEKMCAKWSQRICQFLAGKQIPMLEHTPYSPDVPLCDLHVLKIEKFTQRNPFLVN